MMDVTDPTYRRYGWHWDQALKHRIEDCTIEEGDYGHEVCVSFKGNQASCVGVSLIIPREDWDNVVAPAIARYEADKKPPAGYQNAIGANGGEIDMNGIALTRIPEDENGEGKTN